MPVLYGMVIQTCVVTNDDGMYTHAEEHTSALIDGPAHIHTHSLTQTRTHLHNPVEKRRLSSGKRPGFDRR